MPKPVPKAAELQRRDLQLKAMKELVGRLAHSFNNGLAPMTGYITLLAEEVPSNTPSEQYVNKLEGSVRKSEGMIDAIVQATHPEKHYFPRRTDFKLLLEKNAEAWMKALPASADIAVHTDLAPCTLTIDEPLWGKLALHVLSNAQHALEGGGAVQLSLHPKTFGESEAKDLGLSETDVFELVIEDNGCGMSEEVAARAWDPMFSTHAYGPTAGLGLTFVHSVVQLHGGQVAMYSEEGGGTAVAIWLPRSLGV